MNETQNLVIVLYLLVGWIFGVFHQGSMNARLAVAVFFPIFVVWALVLGVLELVGLVKPSSPAN